MNRSRNRWFVNSPRKGRDREREGTKKEKGPIESEEGGVEAEQWVKGEEGGHWVEDQHWVGIEGEEGSVEDEH
jgi:hypothetical protein